MFLLLTVPAGSVPADMCFNFENCYKYGRRVFWTKGYYVNTVGGNEAKIRKYIRDQEAEDQMCDQLSFKEYEDPFKNVADFDDDDSPEVPTDSMKK